MLFCGLARWAVFVDELLGWIQGKDEIKIRGESERERESSSG